MITYAEKSGKKKFDWFEALKDAKDGLSPEDYIGLSKLSNSWVTCACGNLCESIPRDSIGTPLDEELCNLGYDFHNFIEDRCFDSAIETLKKIERRSAELQGNSF